MEKKKECRYRSNGVINEGAGSRKTNAKGKHEQKMYRCMVNSAERGGGGGNRSAQAPAAVKHRLLVAGHTQRQPPPTQRLFSIQCLESLSPLLAKRRAAHVVKNTPKLQAVLCVEHAGSINAEPSVPSVVVVFSSLFLVFVFFFFLWSRPWGAQESSLQHQKQKGEDAPERKERKGVSQHNVIKATTEFSKKKSERIPSCRHHNELEGARRTEPNKSKSGKRCLSSSSTRRQ
jgi:hypothetical protein